MSYVVEVKYIKDYRLKINFDDGHIKEVDLASYLEGPVFEPLKELAVFKKVKVNDDIGTICWDNGADLAPEFLKQIGRSP